MTRKDFIDWKSSPITVAMFKAIQANIDGLKEELAYSAGMNPTTDSLKVGAIRAFRDVIEADWFEETEV